jgi:hypothetical protein
MAAYTILTSQNIDTLAAKAGGDTYTISGGTLIIDQDSRTGLNQSTSSSLGSITISASLGGTVNIDGTSVWMIPFTGGTGNVPAFNTVITNSSGSGKLIGVHASLTSASTATGAAMPTTGFIRVKQKTGAYIAGALTGIGATASDAGRVGWIEIVGDEASTVNANRLGQFNITGAWYEVGVTSGNSNQTMQIPNNGLLRYIAGVYIEKTVGSNDYEFYPNAGTTTTTGTEATRGKVVWIDANGLVRIGNSGAATNGFTPITGLKVVIGNIFFENCTTAARTANVIPNATLATRYDFTTTGGGVLNIDKCNMAWYFSCSQAYSVNVSNSCFVDAILLSEIASPMTFNKVGVGNKPTTALFVSPLTMTFCFAGGTFTDCVWARVSMAASAAHTNTLSDCAGFTFIRDTVRANTIRANATTFSINATRLKNCTWTTPTIIQGAITFTTCDNITITDTVYCEAVSGTTVTTYTGYVWTLSTNTNNCTISGLSLPVVNNQPYTALLQLTTGCDNNKLRNIGTRVVPLTMGSTNGCGLVYSLASACTNTKVQRVYVSNTRTGIMTGDNSSKNLLEESVYGDYADAVGVMAVLNMNRRAMGGTGALTAQTSVYGTHWSDRFISATVGRLAILMNEPTVDTTNQVSLLNGASFTSAGGLYMPVIGHQVTFEMPYFAKGHTLFSNTPLVMAGGTATNYEYNFSIDKNDGAGWSTMTTLNYNPTTLGAALNAIGAINPTNGFKLRLKLRTIVTNATAITSVYLVTTSTAVAQDNQYPLDTFNLTLNGLVSGSDVVILQADTETVLNQVDQNATSNWVHTYETPTMIDIFVSKAGYVPFYIRNYNLQSSNASLPIAQTIDRNFIN